MGEIVSSVHLFFLSVLNRFMILKHRLLDNGSYRLTCLSRPHIVNFLPVGETEKGELNHAEPRHPRDDW